jgi:hypothetical protein
MKTNSRFQVINNTIIDAELRFNCKPDSINLIAVSKKQTTENILSIFEQGQHDFAENYLQEAIPKMDALSHLDLCWHFIGPIQSNKTKIISERFDWVQSVDRYKIAARLSTQRPSHLPPLNILIQVNVNNETSKSGVKIEELDSLCAEVSKLNNLNLRGLMVIPQRYDNIQLEKNNFHQINLLFQSMQKKYAFDTLSMGMSKDYVSAISEGATMVRIGSALFGDRPN